MKKQTWRQAADFQELMLEFGLCYRWNFGLDEETSLVALQTAQRSLGMTTDSTALTAGASSRRQLIDRDR